MANLTSSCKLEKAYKAIIMLCATIHERSLFGSTLSVRVNFLSLSSLVLDLAA